MFGWEQISAYFKANLEEIKKDEVLVKYGFWLSLIHISTFSYWFFYTKAYNYIAVADTAICQPFFQSCRALRFLDPETWRWLLVCYFVLGLAGSILWFKRKIEWAYGFSFFLLFVKFYIYAQDYRMMGNYHYIHYLILFLFLLYPHKRILLPFSIVLVYLGAGILKLNYEWMSGAALFGDIGLLDIMPLEWATAYVVILELCFSWGLLSKNKKIKYAVLAQFAVFHVYSIQIVGLFYPLVMFSVLSLFLLEDKYSTPCEFTFSRLKSAAALVFIGIFVLAQLYPFLMPGKPALTGEGRLFSLNMFDAKAACRHSFLIEGDVDALEKNYDFNTLGPRIKCDPHLYVELAKNMCASIKQDSATQKLHLYLQSKLTSEPEFKERVHIDDICHHMPSFNAFLPNDWIKK